MSIRATFLIVAAVSSVVGCGATPPARSADATPTSAASTTSGMSHAQLAAATVETFEGRWEIDAQVTPPGETKALPAKMTYACEKTAGGKAVRCSYTAEMGGEPAGEGAQLIGYDAFDGKVHFMSMTSDEEFHDHLCVWKNEHDLDCGVFEGGMGGQKVSEELRITSAKPGVITFFSKSRFADGKSCVMEATARRVAAPIAQR